MLGNISRVSDVSDKPFVFTFYLFSFVLCQSTVYIIFRLQQHLAKSNWLLGKKGRASTRAMLAPNGYWMKGLSLSCIVYTTLKLKFNDSLLSFREWRTSDMTSMATSEHKIPCPRGNEIHNFYLSLLYT